MQDRPLQDPLEAQRRLCLAVVVGRQQRRRFVEERLKILSQALEIGLAGTQHLERRRVVGQREQKMLHGKELMTLVTRFLEGEVQREFQLFAQHRYLTCNLVGKTRSPQVRSAPQAGSSVHINGWSLSRA